MTLHATPPSRADHRTQPGAAFAPADDSPRGHAAAACATARANRRRVLVVEDELDIAEPIKHTLERGGDIVELAASGDAALKASSEQPPGPRGARPESAGAERPEVCRILRQRAATATVPIIMLTARTSWKAIV